MRIVNLCTTSVDICLSCQNKRRALSGTPSKTSAVLFLQNPSVPRESDHPPGKVFPTVQQRSLGCALYSAAAGNLHPGNGQTFDPIGQQNLREFFPVIPSSNFGQPIRGNTIFHKLLVEISIGIGRTVCGYEKMGPGEIRRPNRHQLDLDWPLSQAALPLRRKSRRRSLFSAYGAGLAAGTAAR